MVFRSNEFVVRTQEERCVGGKLIARGSFLYMDLSLFQNIYSYLSLNNKILSSDLIVTTISTMDTKKVRRLKMKIVYYPIVVQGVSFT